MSGITIAIPTYNRGSILVETIDRLLGLEPRADEIVIVDQDAGTPAGDRGKARGVVATRESESERLEKLSVPAAMNHALRIARQPIVLFVDDDLIPDPSLAREISPAWQRHLGCGRPSAPAGRGAASFREEPSAPRDLPATSSFRSATTRDGRRERDGRQPVGLTRAGALHRRLRRAVRLRGEPVESDFARRVIAAGGRIRFEPRARIRHLKLPTGGVRSHGDPRRTAAPTHSAGDYLFAIKHVPGFWPYAARRFRQNVFTRYTLAHPVAIPMKAIAELRGRSSGAAAGAAGIFCSVMILHLGHR